MHIERSTEKTTQRKGENITPYKKPQKKIYKPPKGFIKDPPNPKNEQESKDLPQKNKNVEDMLAKQAS